RRETADIILIGNLLIEAHKHLGRGEWKPYLAENFDMSYRTAINYTNAAEYVERQKQKCNVALLDFKNLSPTVLYWLAAGCNYNEQEEAAILAATCEGRVDHMRAQAICEKLAALGEEDDQGEEEKNETATPAGAEDPEITAILDGPS